MLDRIAAVASLVPFAIGTAAGPPDPPHSVDLTFQDPAIVESSGLVVRGGLFLTTNDSGDGGRVFVVDGSGATVGTTSWEPEPADVEALAPAGRGFAWVGDIGDNPGTRDHVEVVKVPYGRESRDVGPASYSLVYPDGPHDAETLLAHPRTGQLFVVSKDIFGGTVYAAPRTLSADRPNRLRAVADSLGFATDGSFFPDGRHYILRGYRDAAVYTFPGHERIALFRLPSQRQGEGIAVDRSGGVHISTEGQFTDVLRVDLPASVVKQLRSPTPTAGPTPAAAEEASDDERSVWPWALGGVVAVGFVGALARLLLRHGPAS